MYASLWYIFKRHPWPEIPGQSSQAPQPEPSEIGVVNGITNGEAAASQQKPEPVGGDGDPRFPLPIPDHPDRFNAAMHEFAQDLVVKEQQMEHIISLLPGIGSNEASQEKRLRELEEELRQLDEERARKEVEKQNMVDLLGEAIGKIKRVP